MSPDSYAPQNRSRTLLAGIVLIVAVAFLTIGKAQPTHAHLLHSTALAALSASDSIFFDSTRNGAQDIYRYDYSNTQFEGSSEGNSWTFKGTVNGTSIVIDGAEGSTGLTMHQTGTLVNCNTMSGTWLQSDGQGTTWSATRPVGNSCDISGTWSITFVVGSGNESHHTTVYTLGTVKRITNVGAAEAFPSASPDGTRVCFESHRTGNYEIFCTDRDGNNPVNLTNDPGEDGMPRFSPDGTKIAYHHRTVGEYFFQIWVMNADGSNKRQLTFENGYMGEVYWFPDSAKLIFDGDKPDRNLLTINLDGTGLSVINNQPGEQRRPSISPDGRYVYYDSSQSGTFQIYRMQADGSNQTALTSSGQNILPQVSPDGTMLAFTSDRDAGNMELYVSNNDGTNQTRLTASSGNDLLPAWSRPIQACSPETVIVPFAKGPNGVTSQQTFSGQVTLTVAGTGQSAGGQYSDAFYIYADANGTAITPQHPTAQYNWVLWINNQHAENLIVGRQVPAYRADHTYTFAINAPGGNLSFGVGDTATNDNTGSYTISLCGAALPTYSVSGRIITSNGAGLGSVTISDGTHSTTTASDGSYTLSGLAAGSYTLTPSRSGYSFSPSSRTITVSGNLTGQDFTGTAQTYSVSGRVTISNGSGLTGVIISIGSKATTTASDGSYTLSGLAAGSYTLTPSRSGYSFSPSSRTITVSGNLTGQDFSGATEVQSQVNVSISLYANPTSAQRAAYEDIVRYFADGVFEQSNGAHKLGTVTIYPNQGLSGRANIQWIASCHPNAHISGYGTIGLRIEMCNNFSGVDFLTDREAGGYVLAHEWGHYYYSLYDEYRGSSACSLNKPGTPCINDTPVPNSIMNSQWNARGGHYEWLNFSTALNNTRNTAQHRVYGASGWETLARSPALDPRNGVLRSYPTRLYYPELASVAPLPGQAPRIDLVANSTARSALQIVWANGGALRADQPEIVASLTALAGGEIHYPEPIQVLAVLQRSQPIIGALAQGDVVAPDGSSQTVILHDDGIAPDIWANDGLYAALLTYKQDGFHTISVHFTNSAGTAQEISDSGSLAPPLPGVTPELSAPLPITGTFDVSSELTVLVTGVQADDYGDTATASTATLATDGTALAGQINHANDRDLFRVTVTDAGHLAVRVTDLALGMQPQLRLLAADGTTELAKVDLNTSASTDYLLLTHTVTAGTTLYVEIAHSNTAATQGFYRISAGTLLSSESIGERKVYLPLVIR